MMSLTVLGLAPYWHDHTLSGLAGTWQPCSRLLFGSSDPFRHTFGSRRWGSPQDGQPTLLLSAWPLAFDFSPRKSSAPNRVHVTAALRCCSDLAAQESLPSSRPTLERLTA